MRCVAIPNLHFPPGTALAEADETLASITELTPAAIERLGA